eukprot:12566103-Alexandrium_andersonii.AAC.1
MDRARQYCHLILKVWASPVLKDWGRQKETHRRTDGPTDGQTRMQLDRRTQTVLHAERSRGA